MSLFPVFDASAPYIWTVYGLAGVILGAMVLRTALQARRAQTALKQAQDKTGGTG